jgi:hypothetical protein
MYSIRKTIKLHSALILRLIDVCSAKWSSILPFRKRDRARLCTPEMNSMESIPPAYVAWRAGSTNKVIVPPAGLHRLAESIPLNRFPGSLNVYKFILSICDRKDS